MPTRAPNNAINPAVDWPDMLAEGEKRIKSKFLDAMIVTHSQDRARLLTQREVVKRKIEEALRKRDDKKLKNAFREQVKLLGVISRRTNA